MRGGLVNGLEIAQVQTAWMEICAAESSTCMAKSKEYALNCLGRRICADGTIILQDSGLFMCYLM